VNTLVRLKLALVAIGLIIWVWGYRVDDSYLRVVGIIVLLIAVLMRFVGRPRRAKETPEVEPPAP
jgi:asparagine N-glycosylation enzyme membrane subunit Stt3